MPPLGRWFRPVLTAGVTAAIVLGGEAVQAYSRGELAALAKKYPAVAASNQVQTFLGGIPIVGGLVGGLVGSIVIEPAVEATLSEPDKERFRMAHGILKWVPFVEIGALVIGVPLSLYFVWADVLEGPRRARMAAGTAAPYVAAVPLPQAQVAAPALVAASQMPATGNPTTFEEGTKARAVRDVLAEHIEEGGGAKEPYAVASAIVKEKGPERAAAGLPPSEVKAELKAQEAQA